MFRHAPYLTMFRSRLTSSSLVLRRNITTETVTSSSHLDLPPLPSREKLRTAAKLTPPPRPVAAQSSFSPQSQPPPSPSERNTLRRPESPLALPYLFPRNFGQNQRLSVPDSTRALLEEITNSFDAPIRYAFAYGSGVFEQEGYSRDGVCSNSLFVRHEAY
jgi:translocator assembly and maintenance protein 41